MAVLCSFCNIYKGRSLSPFQRLPHLLRNINTCYHLDTKLPKAQISRYLTLEAKMKVLTVGILSLVAMAAAQPYYTASAVSPTSTYEGSTATSTYEYTETAKPCEDDDDVSNALQPSCQVLVFIG